MQILILSMNIGENERSSVVAVNSKTELLQCVLMDFSPLKNATISFVLKTKTYHFDENCQNRLST